MNILLTSVGRRSYMVHYFQSALAGKGEVHACNNSYSVAMKHANHVVISPDIYSDNYINFLLKYCKKNNIKLIVPVFDIDLPVLSLHKNIFQKEGIHILVSDMDAIKICNDKYLTYQFLRKHRIATPETCLSIADAKKLLEENKFHFPLILKPRWGMGSMGVYQVDTFQELKVLYKKIKRDVFKSYLKFESALDIKHCVVIQEKLSGQEYGLDVFNDLHGRYITTVPKIKLGMRAGETDVAKIIKHKGFNSLGKKLSKELAHIGNLDVDCFLQNGNKFVLDLNCRFGGQYPFAHLAGINFPLQIITWLKGGKTNMKLFSFETDAVIAKDISLVNMNYPL